MSNKKYKLKKDKDSGLYRIIALVDIPCFDVKIGDVGGLIQSEKNLSHSGTAWVYGDAQVYGNAQVYDDARISGDAKVYGSARISGDAQIYGDAKVYDDAMVYGRVRVYGDALIYGSARISGDAWIYGNAQVYDDAQIYGRARISDDARIYGNAWISGNAWIYGDAQIYGDARIYSDALIYDDARIYGSARISGDAQIYGDAKVYDDAQVYGDAWIYGRARIYGNAWIYGNAKVYDDARIYSDARISGNAKIYDDIDIDQVDSEKPYFTKNELQLECSCGDNKFEPGLTQIDKLANFIMAEVEGEPSKSEGAGDCAIRIIQSLLSQRTVAPSELAKVDVDVDVDGIKEKIYKNDRWFVGTDQMDECVEFIKNQITKPAELNPDLKHEVVKIFQYQHGREYYMEKVLELIKTISATCDHTHFWKSRECSK